MYYFVLLTSMANEGENKLLASLVIFGGFAVAKTY